MKRTLAVISLAFMALTGFAQDFYLGADISWKTELESKGRKLYNWKGEERECTALMKEMGMNAIRLRVWVDPSEHENWCNKEDLLAKAKRAKELGMEVMVDFHYSDWWADPGKQNIPKAWEKLSFKKMTAALVTHTNEVLTLLKENGITPKWVQVGNETSNGMLWPIGKLDQNPKQYAGFFAAGYDAVKAVFPDAKVIVHLDNGFDSSLYNRNLEALKDNGAKWDIIGMSLYPYWAMKSGKESNAIMTIYDCMKNIRKVSEKYGTDVMIVETGYEVDEQKPWVMEQGREQYAELIRRMKNDTKGRCRGVFYWEPESRPSQYNLGAFSEEGKPTVIIRALLDEQIREGRMDLAMLYDRKLVKLHTTEGDIVVELYNETPKHRDNFLRLAKSGALDSTLFHRVIKDFMIQGGDPDSKTATYTSVENPTPLGSSVVPGENGEEHIDAEILYPQFFHKRGALCAARDGDDQNPQFKSSTSQFYITWGKWPVQKGKNPYKECLEYYEGYQQSGTPWLDGGYTVFGQVVSGLDVVEKIQQSETDGLSRPLIDVRILKFEVLN